MIATYNIAYMIATVTCQLILLTEGNRLIVYTQVEELLVLKLPEFSVLCCNCGCCNMKTSMERSRLPCFSIKSSHAYRPCGNINIISIVYMNKTSVNSMIHGGGAKTYPSSFHQKHM